MQMCEADARLVGEVLVAAAGPEVEDVEPVDTRQVKNATKAARGHRTSAAACQQVGCFASVARLPSSCLTLTSGLLCGAHHLTLAGLT